MTNPEEFSFAEAHDIRLDPPVERDWPTWQGVVDDCPELCMEEQTWVLDALLIQAHARREQERSDGQT